MDLVPAAALEPEPRYKPPEYLPGQGALTVCGNHREVEPWKLRLVERRARRFGFRGAELDDARQEVLLDVLAFRYDSAKANGAGEQAALQRVIDRRLQAIRRARVRRQSRVSSWDAAFGGPDAEPAAPEDNSRELALDVRNAVAALSPEDRELVAAVAEGQSLRQLAIAGGTSRRKLQAQLERIRRHFAACGLDESLPAEE